MTNYSVFISGQYYREITIPSYYDCVEAMNVALTVSLGSQRAKAEKERVRVARKGELIYCDNVTLIQSFD